jgi:hypothetical protein
MATALMQRTPVKEKVMNFVYQTVCGLPQGRSFSKVQTPRPGLDQGEYWRLPFGYLP